MSSIGVDLTGASAFVFEHGNNEDLLSTSWTPSTIMPMLTGGDLIAGSQNKKHRRGAGFDWPPESQVPYCFKPELGFPRWPLARVWQEILPLGTDKKGWDDYKTGSLKIEWRPDINKPPVGIPAEDHIVQSVEELISKRGDIRQLCLVVPDDLGEGAQQAILDRWRATRSDVELHLVPRPIAIAMHWCQLQEGARHRHNIIDPKTGCCGHLIVLAMGLDRWEIVPIEIRVVEDSTGPKLIAVRDHTIHNSEIAVDGFSLLAAYGISTGLVSKSKLWNRFMCGDLIPSLNKYGNTGSLLCETTKLDFVLSDLRSLKKNWMPCPQGDKAIFWLARVNDKINQKLYSQLNDLNRNAKENLLGIVSDGIFSRLPLGNSFFSDYLLRDYKNNQSKILFGPGTMSAKGAAQIAHDLIFDSRTYRDRIAPIDIWYYDKDEFQDPVLDTMSLIDSRDIEAGKTYESPEAIRGLVIRENADKLEITLRRKFGDREFNRKIQANLKSKTTDQKKVLLSVKAKPGQGFARVDVESEKPGLFETQLNWRKMVEADKPSKPKYAWPPGMANILCDRGMFKGIEYLFKKTIIDLENWRWKISFRYNNNNVNWLREELNKWPRFSGNSDNLIGFTEKLPTTYLYRGCVPSSSTLSCPENGLEFERLSNALDAAIRLDCENESLIRLAGWLYQACPEAALEVARKHLRVGKTTSADLILIGNVFEKPEDIKLFYQKWINFIINDESNNNWLRAFRNMIRFRPNALSKDVVSDLDLTEITNHVYYTMSKPMGFRFSSQIYDNCLYIAPHLLKRRKFQPEFLSPSSVNGRLWIELFEKETSDNYDFRKDAAEATLNFLKKEGSQEDLEKLWRSEK